MNSIDIKPIRKRFCSGLHALWLALLLVTAAVFTASDAEATHFRFGHITWKATGTNTAEITVLHAWRCTFFFSSSACTSGSIVGGAAPAGVALSFGGGSPTSSNITGTVIFNDAASNWYLAKYVTTHTYPSQGPFTASFTSCCRISSLQNSNNDQTFTVTTDIDFRNSNTGSPVSSIPAIVQFPKTTTPTKVVFPLPVADPDSDATTCRLATTAESSLITAAPTAGGKTLSVTSDCKLEWDTSGTTFGQFYALQVMIQEHRPNNVINDIALDFIIEIANVSLNAQPTCTVNGSASNIVNVGQNFSITLTGSDTDGGNLTVANLGLPPGATLTPASGTSPVTATFNWTPQSSDAGSAHAVTVLFTDLGNLTASCGFSITVPANRPPDAICQDVTVNADANCKAGADINNGSFDPDGDPITLVQNPAAPPATPFGLGSTLTTLTVTDNKNASDSCQATVTVNDVTPPGITCPAGQTLECVGGGASATVNATATDNCSVSSVGCSPGSGTFALGTTPVSCSATDGSGNSSSCGTTVKVQDTTPPSISCPAAIVAECTGNSSAPVTPGAASASDICAGVTVVGPAAGMYPVGTTTVTYTATDGVGLQSSCQATIQVVDTTKPVVSCVESFNPSGKNVPRASNINQDGFYKISGGDTCSAPVIMLGSFAIANGETIKITQTPGKSGVTFVNRMGPEQIRHFQVGAGDAVITATDGSGNNTSVTCLVPPPPK